MISFDDSYVPLSQEDIRIILKNMAGNMKMIDVTSETLEVYVRLYRLCENREGIAKPKDFLVNWIDNPNFDPDAYYEYAANVRHRCDCQHRQEAYECASMDCGRVMGYRKDAFREGMLKRLSEFFSK